MTIGPADAAMRAMDRARDVGSRASEMRRWPLIVVALLVVLTFVSTVVIAWSELARSGHMNNAAATPLR
jgi:hypothetical protein